MTNKTLLLRLLAFVTLAVLVLSLASIQVEYIGLAAFFGALTAVTVYFGVLLSQGEISTAYLVGILGILLLPAEAQATLTWGIFVGGLIGSMVRSLYHQRRPRYHRTAPMLNTIVAVSARVTLSFVLAGRVYGILGGQQPLTGISGRDILPLLGLYGSDVTIYFAVFLLAIYIDGRSLREALLDNRLLLLTVMVVPVPMIVLSASLAIADPMLVLLLVLVVLTGINGILYSASRIRYVRWRQQRELQALASISQAMRANQSPDTLLATVYQELARLLFIDYFMVALVEGGQLQVPLRVQHGRLSLENLPIQRDTDTLLDHVLEMQSPLMFSHDAIQQARRMALLAPDEAASAWLGVPLLAAGRALGVLVIASSDPTQRFGPEELHILNIIAAATSAHIDNAQLYTQQTERAVQLANLNTVLALLTETLSPDEVLDTVISSASAISEATAVAVYRYHERQFDLVRSAGLTANFSLTPILTVHTIVQAHEADQPFIVEDMANDSRADSLREAVAKEGKSAWIELPLAVSGQSIGAIILYFDHPQNFTSEHVEHLRTFANQAAQAIQNADLYAVTYQALEHRIEQLSALAQLGRELLTTTERETIAELLLRYALAATHTTSGAVLLKENDRDNFSVVAHQGYPRTAFKNQALVHQGITGRVLREGEIINRSMVGEDTDYMALLPDTTSQLSVPMIWQDQVLGAITLENPRLNYFNGEHTAFVAQLVNQVAFAIENAHLFHDAAEGRDRMQAILNTMTEALILVDRHERVALANPRVAMLGLDSQTLIGVALPDLLADAALDLVKRLGFQSNQDLLGALRDPRGPVTPYVYTLTSSKAPLHIHREIIPVEDEQGEVVGTLMAFYDETTRHNLDRAREEFSQMIIHDLRSPLTAVTSSVMLLTEVIPPENEFSSLVAKTAGSSQRAIRKLLNRVDSLLDVSRMKSGQMTLQLEIARLGGLINNVQAELEPLANDLAIEIIAQMPADEPDLVIDTEKVERVLLNLVDNALKFSPRNGNIYVQAEAAMGGEGPFLRVEVLDQGPGVPEAERQSIFDRYVQIQQQGPKLRRGSGLGLNFCKLAVEAHGGTIWIEENPAGGSIFAFTLPIFTGDNLPTGTIQ